MQSTSFSRKALAPVFAAVALACAGAASAASLAEGFDNVATLAGSGWTQLNNSTPTGASGWFQGNPATLPGTGPFDAFAGSPNSYIGANYNNTTGANTISNWLWTPSLTFNNGDVVRFYTRTVVSPATFADRLELRFSTGTVAAPVGAAGVGSFSSLLLSVNPGLTSTGYPSVWTLYSATISGLAGPTSGNVALRYFVTAGGPAGSNSDYIGIDSFSITPVPEPGTLGLLGLGVAGVLLAARRRQQAA